MLFFVASFPVLPTPCFCLAAVEKKRDGCEIKAGVGRTGNEANFFVCFSVPSVLVESLKLYTPKCLYFASCSIPRYSLIPKTEGYRPSRIILLWMFVCRPYQNHPKMDGFLCCFSIERDVHVIIIQIWMIHASHFWMIH